MWYGEDLLPLRPRRGAAREHLGCDLATNSFRQVTHFNELRHRFSEPRHGRRRGAGIVFQQGGSLYVLDLPSEQLHKLDVTVPDDGIAHGPAMGGRRQAHPRPRHGAGRGLHASHRTAARGAFSARGDIFTLPAEHGATRNLTDTSNADEDHPTWSPDGKTIAYTTDGSGEQQIAIRPAEGGPEKLLTHFQTGLFLLAQVVAGRHAASPSRDGEHRLWYVSAAGGAPRRVAEDKYNEIHD